MNQMQNVFNFQNNELRTIQNGDYVWFAGKDVCAVLDIKNTTQALQRLDDDEVTMFNIGGLIGETNFVNESGLYSLVLGSRKAEAKEFKRWITREVIPSIRKTGSYQQKEMTPSELALLQAQNLVNMERKLVEQDNRIEKIETEHKNISEIIGLSVVEWRKKVTGILNRIAKAHGGFEMFKDIRNESYKILEDRAKCKLSIRVTNKQKVMALNGVAKSTVNKVSKLDAISDDARLTEIYLAIVKELAVKYQVNADVEITS